MTLATKLGYAKYAIKECVRVLKREPPITPGEFDLNSLRALLGKEDPVILDVGCNDGSHTLAFLRLFTNARIYAFEPDARALHSFSTNVSDSRVKLFPIAISRIDGVSEFHVSDGYPSSDGKELRPGGWDLSGSIKKPKKHLAVHPWCKFEQTQLIASRRLDSWRQEHAVESIDLVWADVQGAEEDLITGALETLRRTHYFYTEYSNEELYEGQITLRRMQKLLPDFEVMRRFENDVLFQNKRWKR